MAKPLVIFDLDGTLVDSIPDLTTAVNEVLKTFECCASVEQVRGWVGNGSLVLIQRALDWAKVSATEADIGRAHEAFLAAYALCASEKTIAYEGVKHGLAYLKQQGFLLAIATNKPMQFVPKILQHVGVSEFFDIIIAGDSLPKKKPDPYPLWHICQTLDVPCERSVMVGDSKNDIQAGKAAGMTTLAVRYGYNYNEPIDNSAPDQAFDDFSSLVVFLVTHFASDS